MFVITIHFLNGAYHATPWGKHVNEGVPEWPPSSWRLLRAIIATWKNIRPDLSEKSVWPILQKLIKDLPDYELPDASVSHTRHWMPTDKVQLVMDTFIVVGDRPVNIIWDDLILSKEETDILESILKNLHYFGRAESWCTASTSTEHRKPNCYKFDKENPSADTEIVRVLAPKPDISFVDISKQKTESDKDDLNSISITTEKLQDNQYIDPPGGRWVQYVRPQNCFEEKLTPRTQTSLLNNVTLVRYAVVGTLRPSIRDILRVGDMSRTACMSRYGKKKNGKTSAIFSGKDMQGHPLKDHRHAYFLPTYETQNKEIDHLTIIAAGGFDKYELDVLFALKKLYRYNTMDVHLVFQGCGTPDNFSDIPILGKSQRWVSATPLILTRHVKYRGKGSDKHVVDSPDEQIRNEIKNRYGSEYELENITIDENQTAIHNTNVKPIDFFQWRSHGSVGNRKSYKVQLEFKKPVKGPINLGYAAHFGLGMFVPLEGDD